jgi:BirA family biotin operon repressor/biotin-[acetyl-CoA-carboxylase] ligase
MWPRERLDAIDSTQLEAKRRLAQPTHVGKTPPTPFGLWTAQQARGIASHGRSWQDASLGLALSVAWPEQAHSGHAIAWPVRLSLAVVSVLESAYPVLAQRLGVKWPNDIMCGHEKLAGVLVTRHTAAGVPWLIAGIGINLEWKDPPRLGRPVTSLKALGVRDIDEGALVDALCCGISQLSARPNDDACWRQTFERRDVHYRRRVSVVHPVSGRLLHEGIAEGISDAGALMLRVGEKLLAIQIGEVSVRVHHEGQDQDHLFRAPA